MYGGEPIAYDSHDDDLGLLLTVLLLAAKNSNGNCCNYCNCRSESKIPVPYPIPIPINNPVINNHRTEYVNNDSGNSKKSASNNTSKQKPMPSVNYTLTYVPVLVESDSEEYDYS